VVFGIDNQLVAGWALGQRPLRNWINRVVKRYYRGLAASGLYSTGSTCKKE
jgi:hypothetical protein